MDRLRQHPYPAHGNRVPFGIRVRRIACAESLQTSDQDRAWQDSQDREPDAEEDQDIATPLLNGRSGHAQRLECVHGRHRHEHRCDNQQTDEHDRSHREREGGRTRSDGDTLTRQTGEKGPGSAESGQQVAEAVEDVGPTGVVARQSRPSAGKAGNAIEPANPCSDAAGLTETHQNEEDGNAHPQDAPTRGAEVQTSGNSAAHSSDDAAEERQQE